MFHKNTIQILAIVAFNCAMVAYAGVQVKQASDILVRTSDDSLSNMILTYFARAADPTPYHASQPYEIVVLSLMVVFASGFAFIAYRLYKEFGWTIYKKIGADLAMRGMFNNNTVATSIRCNKGRILQGGSNPSVFNCLFQHA
jgi:heterodisulfide reductase subunit A-like polyferredoxin